MSEVTVQQLESEFKNNSRHNFEGSLLKAINLSGVDVSRKPSDKEIRYMQMVISGN